jgi:antitoxin component YwqK of YwqJK toxin-antitoxin module
VAVAENPNTSPDTFKILVQDQSHFIRMTVAANPKIPADLAESLSKGKDKWLRRNLARYTTYHEIIKYLAKDEFEFVREAVAENPNTPPDVLEKLAQNVDKSAKKKEITLDDLLKSESEVLNSIGLELHNEEEPAKPRKKQNHVSNIHHTSGNNSFHSSGGIRHSSSSGSRRHSSGGWRKKEDGLHTEWYENGQKKSEGTFKDGKGDGLYTSWYENGQKKLEIQKKNGDYDGLVTSWYENGQKKSEGTYKDSKRYGLFQSWYENGQKSSERTFKDGELISEKIWNQDGSVKE